MLEDEHSEFQLITWLITALGNYERLGPLGKILHNMHGDRLNLYNAQKRGLELGFVLLDKETLLNNAEDLLKALKELRELILHGAEFSYERNSIMSEGLLRNIPMVAKYNRVDEKDVPRMIRERESTMQARVAKVIALDDSALKTIITDFEDVIEKLKALPDAPPSN
jgi:hypothetical protein